MSAACWVNWMDGAGLPHRCVVEGPHTAHSCACDRSHLAAPRSGAEETPDATRYRVMQAEGTGRWWLWKGTPSGEGWTWDTLHLVDEVIPLPGGPHG